MKTDSGLLIRKQFNSIFSIICKLGGNYLNEFFNYSLKIIHDFKRFNDYSLNSYRRLKTIVIALEDLSKRRAHIRSNKFREFLMKFLPEVFMMFQQTTQGLDRLHELKEKEIYMKISLILDKLLIYLIFTGNNYFNEDQIFKQIVKNLVQKAEKIFFLIKKSENKEIQISEDLFEILVKNGVVLTFDFKTILDVSPLIMREFLGNFLEFVTSILQVAWKTEKLKKSISLLLLKILKTFLFYTKPEEIISKGITKKLKIKHEAQKICC